MLAAVHDTATLLTILGWAIVAGIVIAAAVVAFRGAWIPAAVLAGIAIVAAIVLLP